MNGPKHYVISVTGYEDYRPVWFMDSGEDEKDFEETVQAAMAAVLPELISLDNHGYICGYDLQDAIVPEIEKNGFIVVKPEVEIDLRGECLYREGEFKKPDLMSNEDWHKILNHNDEIDKEVYEDL